MLLIYACKVLWIASEKSYINLGRTETKIYTRVGNLLYAANYNNKGDLGNQCLDEEYDGCGHSFIYTYRKL